jgi:putative toxin-antitoxin system antitoxin component (TIGR02293 family)
MKASDDFTLRAFLSALAQLEHPLDSKTQTELNQVASTLAQDDVSAIKQLRKLAEQDPAIHERYNIALEELYDTYQAQPRNKFLLLSEPTTASSQSTIDTSPTFDLVTASHQVLGASESVGTARQLRHLITAYEHATEVLENSDSAWNWLKKPNRALGGAIPIKLLETESGTEKVYAVLNRIQYGGYS